MERNALREPDANQLLDIFCVTIGGRENDRVIRVISFHLEIWARLGKSETRSFLVFLRPDKLYRHRVARFEKVTV
jgi:hypothetical protein